MSNYHEAIDYQINIFRNEIPIVIRSLFPDSHDITVSWSHDFRRVRVSFIYLYYDSLVTRIMRLKNNIHDEIRFNSFIMKFINEFINSKENIAYLDFEIK